jgi:hypothetical protein
LAQLLGVVLVQQPPAVAAVHERAQPLALLFERLLVGVALLLCLRRLPLGLLLLRQPAGMRGR